MAERFRLSDGDRSSAAWLNFKRHAEERLALLRAKNDSALLDERRTARLRGQIAELKYIISLGEPKQLAPPDDGLD